MDKYTVIGEDDEGYGSNPTQEWISDSGTWYKVTDVDALLKNKDALIDRQQDQLAEQAAFIIHLTVRVEDADRLVAQCQTRITELGWDLVAKDEKITELRQHGDDQMFELNMLRAQCKEFND